MTLPVGFYVNRIIAHLYFKVYIAKRAKKKNRLTAIPLSVRDRIRTHDLLVRSQTLYPAELRAPGIESVLSTSTGYNITCGIKSQMLF